MATKKRVAGLDIPASATGDIRAFLEAVKEHLELHVGDPRAPNQRAVTIQDLVDAGIATATTKGSYATAKAVPVSASGAATVSILDNFNSVLQITREQLLPQTQMVLLYDEGTTSYRRISVSELLASSVSSSAAGGVTTTEDVEPTFEILNTDPDIASADDADWRIMYGNTAYSFQAVLENETTKDILVVNRAAGVIQSVVFGNATDATPVEVQAGTAAAPTLTFATDPNTGLYSVSADDLGFTVGGTLRLDISTALANFTVATQHTTLEIGDATDTTLSRASAGVVAVEGVNLAFQTVTLTAGAGLTGGGDLSADRTFTVGAGTGITVNADDVALNAATIASLALADAALPAASYTAADVLAKLLTVDGTGSGLDADTLDGHDTAYFLAASAVPVGANPSATYGVDLAGANGSATSFLRSDAVLKLNPAITPTWTGAHTFSALVTANLGITVAGAPILNAAGTVGAPSYSFSGDPDTGLYSISANALGVALGGALALDLGGTAGAMIWTGAATDQRITVENTSTTDGTQARLAISAGSNSFAFFVFNQNFTGAGVTNAPTGPKALLRSLSAIPIVFGTSNAFAAMFDGTSQQFLTIDGTASLPSHSFRSDPDTGMYRSGANAVALAAGGAAIALFSSSSITFNKQVLSGSGYSGSVPMFSVAGDTGTGFGADTTSRAVVVAGGTIAAYFATTFTQVQGILYAIGVVQGQGATSAVGAGQVTFSFYDDTDTGMYRSGANLLSFAIGGVEALTLSGAPVTGAQTATFIATNKPGTGTAGPTTWLPVKNGATTYYIPMFGA